MKNRNENHTNTAKRKPTYNLAVRIVTLLLVFLLIGGSVSAALFYLASML